MLPTRIKKAARRTEQKTVLLLRRGAEVLVTQRPAKGLLASLWEFPCLAGGLTAAEVAEIYSLPEAAVTPLGKATHIFTHILWEMEGYMVQLGQDAPIPEGCLSVLPEELFAGYAVPSAYAAYLKVLREETQNS